jgi:hypothetical protein
MQSTELEKIPRAPARQQDRSGCPRAVRRGRAPQRLGIRVSVGGWSSACQSLSTRKGAQAQKARHRLARKLGATRRQQPASHSPSGGARPRAAAASPASGRRSIRRSSLGPSPPVGPTSQRRAGPRKPTGVRHPAAPARFRLLGRTQRRADPPSPANLRQRSVGPAYSGLVLVCAPENPLNAEQLRLHLHLDPLGNTSKLFADPAHYGFLPYTGQKKHLKAYPVCPLLRHISASARFSTEKRS